MTLAPNNLDPKARWHPNARMERLAWLFASALPNAAGTFVVGGMNADNDTQQLVYSLIESIRKPRNWLERDLSALVDIKELLQYDRPNRSINFLNNTLEVCFRDASNGEAQFQLGRDELDALRGMTMRGRAQRSEGLSANEQKYGSGEQRRLPAGPVRAATVNELFREYRSPTFHAVIKSVSTLMKQWHTAKDDIVNFFLRTPTRKHGRGPSSEMLDRLRHLSDFICWWDAFATDLDLGLLDESMVRHKFSPFFEFFGSFLRDFASHYERQPSHLKPSRPYPWQASIWRLCEFFSETARPSSPK